MTGVDDDDRTSGHPGAPVHPGTVGHLGTFGSVPMAAGAAAHNR